MTLFQVLNLIEEGKTAKKRGFRFKIVRDPKTQKTHMIQITRGVDDENASSMRKGGSYDLTKPIKSVKTGESVDQLDSNYKTVNGTVTFPHIGLPNPRGTDHPGVFYHEVGHVTRNTDDMNRIRQEKTAWQAAKDIAPNHYEQAKKDGTISDSFGSYLKNRKYINKSDELQKQATKINPDFDKLSDDYFNQRGNLRTFVSKAKESGYSRQNIANFAKSRKQMAKNTKTWLRNGYDEGLPHTKRIDLTSDQTEDYNKKGWSSNRDD